MKPFHLTLGSIRVKAVLFVSLVVQIFIIGKPGDDWISLVDSLQRAAKGIDDFIDVRSRGNQRWRQRDRVTG